MCVCVGRWRAGVLDVNSVGIDQSDDFIVQILFIDLLRRHGRRGWRSRFRSTGAHGVVHGLAGDQRGIEPQALRELQITLFLVAVEGEADQLLHDLAGALHKLASAFCAMAATCTQAIADCRATRSISFR